MNTDIRLFIGGTEVEFSTTPQVLYNYKVTDYTNPTSIRNGYSKSIQVPSTPSNDILFDHIFLNDRVQGNGFNALKRADFQLFVNGVIFEKGYVKLNTIKRIGNNITYDITLYGSIGSFLYSLSTVEGSDKKMSLADLTYSNYDYPEPDMDFEINKEAVNEAWDRINGYHSGRSKWDILNFAVTSEGLVDDFECGKVLINTYQNRSFSGASTGYGPILGNTINNNGFVLGELSNEITADMSFDLRSYLLRPTISVRSIFDAIKNPSVNGGFEVYLDDHFFNYDNPYYWQSHMTLPTLRELSIEKTTSGSTSSASMTKTDRNHYRINYTLPFGKVASTMELKLNLSISASTSATEAFPYRMMQTTTTSRNYIWAYWHNTGIILQLLGYNDSNEVVAYSDAVYVGGNYYKAGIDNTGNVFDDYTYGDKATNRVIPSKFKKIGGEWKLVDTDDNQIDLRLTIPASHISRVELYLETPTSQSYMYGGNKMRRYNSSNKDESGDLWFYSSGFRRYDGNIDINTAAAMDRISAIYQLSMGGFNVDFKDDSTLFSGTKITKDKLLATDFSPADWLISYCKLFGLYIYSDPEEVAIDELNCPNGVIHIVDRDTFYNENVINLQQYIDRSKEMVITPAVAKSRYLKFECEGIDSDAEQKYQATYGFSYGRQLVDTSMDFDADTTDLYDGNVFKSGVMVQERNRYLSAPVGGVPVYAFDGLKYTFFKPTTDGFDTDEKEYKKQIYTCTPINQKGLDYYDSMPKLQVRGENWSAGDGKYVLLFYDGMKSPMTSAGTQVTYWLTDDLKEMAEVNDGAPCWLMTQTETDVSGNSIAIARSSIPNFTRDIIRGNNIVNSWNFGHPKETYIPDTYTTDGDSIYDKCWKSYIRDMYNVDSRILSCSTRLIGKANPEWVRNFYSFDNAIWRINEIKDWNIATNEVTKTEFLKVIDINDYKLNRITSLGSVTITFSKSVVDYTGETITGKVICQDAGNSWAFADYFCAVDELGNSTCWLTDDYISPITGSGVETTFTITIPANTGLTQRTISLGLEDSGDYHYYGSLTQGTDDSSVISFVTTDASFTFAGGNTELQFLQRNMDTGTLSASSSTAWAIPAINGNSVAVVVSNYTGTTTRTATITLAGDDINGVMKSTTATITQTGAGLVIDKNSLVFDYWDRTGQDVTITTSGPWTATEIEGE